jgi:hypothetical protein
MEMKDAQQPEKAAPEAEGQEAEAAQQPGMADAAVHRHRERRWAAADEYNQQHPEEVSEFNRLTGNACVGEGGGVDVQKLRHWQSDHGVITDGKIGPKTLAAAKPKDAVGDAKVDKPKDEKKAGPAAAASVPFLSLEMLEEAIHKIDLWLAKREVKQAEPKAIDAAGLASPVSLSHFHTVATKVQAQWDQLSPRARAGQLMAASNEQLEAAGAVHVAWGFEKLDSETGGAFDAEKWRIKLNEMLYSRSHLGKEDSAQMAATAYHETRHAEQHFRVARMMAGQGMEVAKIVAATKIPENVVAKAHKQPIKEGDPSAKSAAAFANALYGAGKAEHDKALPEARVILQEYKDAQNQVEQLRHKGGADEAHIQELEKRIEAMKPTVARVWAAYSRVATENDALGVEAQVMQSMK